MYNLERDEESKYTYITNEKGACVATASYYTAEELRTMPEPMSSEKNKENYLVVMVDMMLVNDDGSFPEDYAEACADMVKQVMKNKAEWLLG